MLGNKAIVLLSAATLGFSSLALAQEEAASWRGHEVRATAEVRNARGEVLGTVYFLQGPRGTLVQGHLTGLEPGPHGIHVHEVGRCEPPGFTSAGEHYNPGGCRHGFLNPKGPHAGDLPNLWAGANGEVTFEFFAYKLTSLKKALEGDGASIVVHDMEDDYRTDPAGGSGPRIACGVLVRTP